MMTDAQILDALKDLDESEVDVSSWEAKFLDSVLRQKTLSAKQREIALKIIEEYDL